MIVRNILHTQQTPTSKKILRGSVSARWKRRHELRIRAICERVQRECPSESKVRT